MQKVFPHLWFEQQATEAAEFYTSIFPNSEILSRTVLHDTPSGDCDVLSFQLSGHKFMAISAGPEFTANPSISFMLNFDPSRDKNAEQNLQTIWQQMLEGGKILMPLDEYPFSKMYGWIQDKFGISWQLMLTDPAGEERPFIIPSLLFTAPSANRAEEALRFYTSVFKNSKLGTIQLYGEGMEPNKAGTLMFGEALLENVWFAGMDSGIAHDFHFNEAISFMVSCDSQEEIDYYWQKLSSVPESEQCGWLKDKFGVSWQITPVVLEKMQMQGSEEQSKRVTQAFLQMKKFDIAKLQAAYDGNE